MTWKVTTNNHIRWDVYSAFEVDDEVLEELGLDPQDEEDMCKDVIKYRGEWYNLHDFTVVGKIKVNVSSIPTVGGIVIRQRDSHFVGCSEVINDALKVVCVKGCAHFVFLTPYIYTVCGGFYLGKKWGALLSFKVRRRYLNVYYKYTITYNPLSSLG